MVRAKVVIDETSLKVLLGETKDYLPPDVEVVDFFVEENRCATFKIRYDGRKISLKLVPKVYKGFLGIEIWKTFAADLGNIDLSGLIPIMSKVIGKFFKDYPIKIDGKTFYFPDIESTFAGIHQKEVIFDGKWNLH